ncbi:hypothetical protein MRX96_034676 [Rhipicephalus microplus]
MVRTVMRRSEWLRQDERQNSGTATGGAYRLPGAREAEHSWRDTPVKAWTGSNGGKMTPGSDQRTRARAQPGDIRSPEET